MSNITCIDRSESITDGPRIYAACLASYNSGRLYGAWIDCEGKSGDDIRADISRMLKGSPAPSAEEWAIHDHEGFAGLITSEWPDLDDVAAMAEGLALDGRERLGFLFLCHDRSMSAIDALSQAGEVCIFQSDAHDLAADYAQELCDDTIPDFRERSSQWPFTCIDWEHAGRELVIGGDVELCDIDGVRFLVTNPGEF
jgi:antirestriction protein